MNGSVRMGVDKIHLRLLKSLLLPLFILLCTTEGTHAYAEELPAQNVLVLHSYQKGFAWSDEQSAGIEERLKSAAALPVIYTEYMDWKRYPNQENLEHFYETIKFKYQNIRIDAVLTTDDAALSFAMKYRGRFWIMLRSSSAVSMSWVWPASRTLTTSQVLSRRLILRVRSKWRWRSTLP